MSATLGYRGLAAIGALAALTAALLAVLVAHQGIDLGFPSDLIAAVLCYLVGGFAFWKRPQLMATRRLLLVADDAMLNSSVLGPTCS